MHHFGEFTSLLTAIFWTVTALAFEASSRKLGALTVNQLRMVLAFIFLTIFSFFYRGKLFPTDVPLEAWLWLILSGLIGFVFGDLCLMKSFVLIGARVAMLIMALAPPITALIGWLILGEVLSMRSIMGMIVTLTGVALVVLRQDPSRENGPGLKNFKLSYSGWGLLLAFGGALGQATGLVISKYGMKGYDPFASAQIRVLAGTFGFAVLVTASGRWTRICHAFSKRKGMLQMSLGAFFGPFLGVSFSLISIQHTSTGIASTIMAIVPVLIIPPSVFLFKEKVTFREIIGALLAVSGVALFFL